MGFENNQDFVIYNSIAKTIKLMLNLVECNIFLSKKREPLKHVGSSDEELAQNNITDYILETMEEEAEKVFENLKKAGYKSSMEGEEKADWVLIDAFDVIVHIFKPEVRDFYNIEKMWQSAANLRKE